MKVAFATQDLKRVDAHFGWAKNISVYELDENGHQPDRGHRVRRRSSGRRQRGQAGPKIEAVKDCAILYVAAIGGSGAARVVANNIHPIKVTQPENIEDLLNKLQDVLKGNPPPFLRKAMGKGKERVFDLED